MSWYRTGTVTVTAGSAVVTGAGTDFVRNVSPGEAFIGPDLRVYEIAAVVSATVLTVIGTYQGGSAGGQPYMILPTQSFARDLALGAADLLNTFSAVRDGIGQGLVADGTVTTPGLRFTADQDTGFFRPSANAIGIATGGVAVLTASLAEVYVAVPISLPGGRSVAFLPGSQVWTVGDSPAAALYGMTVGVGIGAGGPATVLAGFGGLIFGTGAIEQARIDQGGNLLVGATNGTSHIIKKPGGQGVKVLDVFGASTFYISSAGVGSPAATALAVAANTATGRSINAGGTINASGADYAEYMTKATGCGTIAAGDVCGVDRDGRLTRTWADAISFVVKSTDPAYVGGDSWAAHLTLRPDGPGDEPVRPQLLIDDLEGEQLTAALTAYRNANAVFETVHAAWLKADAEHVADLAAWEQTLEEARWTVDRIAFSGQVPVNVTDEVLAACEAALAAGEAIYLVAVARGGGIGAQAVREGDMTLPLYMRRLGAVWAIRDGRPWLDVQHG